jgi:hypothetical protein
VLKRDSFVAERLWSEDSPLEFNSSRILLNALIIQSHIS